MLRAEAADRSGSSGPATRRGEEIVAVAGHMAPNFATTEAGFSVALEGRKLLSLQFVGSGAGRELGEGFELLVVMTFLGLWAWG